MTAPAVDPFQQFQSYIDPITGQSRTSAQAPAGTPYRPTDPLLTDPMGSTYTPSGTAANPLAGYVSAQGGTFGDNSGTDPNRGIEMDAASYDPTAVARALNSSDPTAQSGAIQGLTGTADASHRQGLLEDSSWAGQFTPDWYKSLNPEAQGSLTRALQGAGGDPAAIQQQLATLGAGDGKLIRTDGGTGPGGTFARTDSDPNQTFDATNAPPATTPAPVDSDPFGRFDDPAHPTHGVITPASEAQLAQQSGTLSAPPPISNQDLTAAGDPSQQTLPNGQMVAPPSVPNVSSTAPATMAAVAPPSGVDMAASAPSSGPIAGLPPGLQQSPGNPVADPFAQFGTGGGAGDPTQLNPNNITQLGAANAPPTTFSGQSGIAPPTDAAMDTSTGTPSWQNQATGFQGSGSGGAGTPGQPTDTSILGLNPNNAPPLSGQPPVGYGLPQFGQAATSGIGGGVSGPFNPYGGGMQRPPGTGAIFGGFRRITPQQTGPGSAGMGNAQGGGGLSDTAY